LKRERWGSPLVQEKYREEKVCEKGYPYIIIIIIIIISLLLTVSQKISFLHHILRLLLTLF